jgi:hypothetical protein
VSPATLINNYKAMLPQPRRPQSIHVCPHCHENLKSHTELGMTMKALSHLCILLLRTSLWGYVRNHVYIPPLQTELHDLEHKNHHVTYKTNFARNMGTFLYHLLSELQVFLRLCTQFTHFHHNEGY